MTKTEQVIAGMLKENTGRHMLDSGGAYGRHWERNQERDFEKEDAVTLKFNRWSEDDPTNWDFELTFNLYHWLTDRLEYSEVWNRRLAAFDRMMQMKGEYEDDRTPWFEILDDFFKWLEENRGGGGIYGERGINTVNTYNDADGFLSQTIQFTYVTVDHDRHGEETVIFLQIHGGCDVRGGYTAPVAFTPNSGSMEGFDIFEYARASIRPEYCESSANQGRLFDEIPDIEPMWFCDDGYEFYGENCNDLGEFECTDDPHEKGCGKIYIDEDGNGYCPYTGRILVAWWY